MIAEMDASDRAELSAEWLAQLGKLNHDDPWVLGFKILVSETGLEVGSVGFKGPVSLEGVVEIAYGVSPDQEGKGYATEAAQAAVRFAFEHEAIQIVRAHTLPVMNASTRILGKLGFKKVGSFEDPEDGTVWRWDLARGTC